MSVANPIIDSIDPVNRLIYLRGSATWPPSMIVDGILNWNPVDDIYTEVRTLRRLDESLRPFDIFCEALPLLDLGGGEKSGRALILLGGTRIIPADEDQSQLITGALLSDEGITGTELIDASGLSAGTKVKLNYEPPPATEIVTVSTGSGLSPEESATLTAILQLIRADEEKNVQLNKYYKRDEDTQAIILEKDYNKDVNDNETLIKP